jgi:hypothetical protein
MRKLNALLKATADSQFNSLAKQANAHLNLRQFWEAVAPKILSQHSFAGSLTSGLLTIYADNASVAAKIKLSSANLLSQLQILQESDPFYKECKVTAIAVKVQVKSQPKPFEKKPRKLSNLAATNLKNLAEQLGDSALSDKLKQLASKQ